MILPTFTVQIGSVERKMSCEIQGTSRKYGKNAGRPYGLGEGGGFFFRIRSTTDYRGGCL